MAEEKKIDPRLKNMERKLRKTQYNYSRLYFAMTSYLKRRKAFSSQKSIAVEKLVTEITKKYSLKKNRETIRTNLYKDRTNLNNWVERKKFENVFYCEDVLNLVENCNGSLDLV